MPRALHSVLSRASPGRRSSPSPRASGTSTRGSTAARTSTGCRRTGSSLTSPRSSASARPSSRPRSPLPTARRRCSPVITERDAALQGTLDERFAALSQLLESHRVDGRFVSYEALTSGAAVAGVVASTATGYAAGLASGDRLSSGAVPGGAADGPGLAPEAAVPFHGMHQAGIIPPARGHRRGLRTARLRTDPHHRLRPLPLRRPLRPRGPQAWTNDPQVAVHAVRNLIRLGFGVVSVRWSQLGFGRTSSTSTAQATPRNLFGFKDRRIRMHIEVWDRTPLLEQEEIFGWDKKLGAPLIPPRHTCASPTRASSAAYGSWRDPGKKFVPMQRALAAQDGLNE